MNAFLVVVAHVVPDQPAKVPLVQRDDVVENLSAATAVVRRNKAAQLSSLVEQGVFVM
jgi:hypothetical protein